MMDDELSSATVAPIAARSPYDAYAHIYDAQGQARWSEHMAAFTIALLPRYGTIPRTVLDLACGTGAAAWYFACAGYRVIGIDRSPAMLAEARCKLTNAREDVWLIRADMRAFALREPVDLVTCYFDSLNYLTDPADLTRAFRQVHAALGPGGLFVADMNTCAGLAADWNDRVRVWERAGRYVVEHAAWDETAHIATLTLTVFAVSGEGNGAFEEIHHERGYTASEITAALRCAAMTPVALFACDRQRGPTHAPPTADTHRVIVVARNDAGRSDR